MRNKKPLGIYLHIPFCVRKCLYCDFLSAPAEAAVQNAYIRKLEEEILSFEHADLYDVHSVFFGGGTPSILDGAFIERLMITLREKFSFGEGTECTIECNPGTLSTRKLMHYRDCGINRLSIGLQSADNGELRLLGRIHTWEEFVLNYRDAIELGFSNINVDLMSALPGQTVESWERTLKKVIALEPAHVSAYSLMIEEGTPFFALYGEEDQNRARGNETSHLPSEEEEREMYKLTGQLLADAGLVRYEISNYAKPGFESIHNSGYWKRTEYAGFGLGASSLLDKKRHKNIECLEDYLKGDFRKQDIQVLSREDEIEETMFLGLRLTKGVNLREFQDTFGERAEDLYADVLKKLCSRGLIIIEKEYLRLTPLGRDISNQVLANFLF